MDESSNAWVCPQILQYTRTTAVSYTHLEERYEILVQQMLDGVQKNTEKLDELLQRLGVDEW